MDQEEDKDLLGTVTLIVRGVWVEALLMDLADQEEVEMVAGVFQAVDHQEELTRDRDPSMVDLVVALEAHVAVSNLERLPADTALRRIAVQHESGR